MATVSVRVLGRKRIQPRPLWELPPGQDSAAGRGGRRRGQAPGPAQSGGSPCCPYGRKARGRRRSFWSSEGPEVDRQGCPTSPGRSWGGEAAEAETGREQGVCTSPLSPPTLCSFPRAWPTLEGNEPPRGAGGRPCLRAQLRGTEQSTSAAF